MKASILLEVLIRLSSSILYTHKLQIWTCIAPKYYVEIAVEPADPINQAIVLIEFRKSNVDSND